MSEAKHAVTLESLYARERELMDELSEIHHQIFMVGIMSLLNKPDKSSCEKVCGIVRHVRGEAGKGRVVVWREIKPNTMYVVSGSNEEPF